jgi:hypothetical protein
MFEFLRRNICKFLEVRTLGDNWRYRIKVGNVAFGFEMRFERWWDLLFEKSIPIYSRKEWMSLEFLRVLFSSESVFGIAIEKLCKLTNSKDNTPLTNDLPSVERVSFGNRTFPNAIFLYIC